MKLTPPQVSRFFCEWQSIVRTQKWTPTEAEAQRKSLLKRCGFSSLTLVDRKDGFDAVLSELGTLRLNLSRAAEAVDAGQIALEAGTGSTVQRNGAGLRRRMLFKIREHAGVLGAGYFDVILKERFGRVAGWNTVEDLTTADLHRLLMTLAARRSSKRAVGAAASLDAEEEFQDDVEFLPHDDGAEVFARVPAAEAVGAVEEPF